MRCRERGAFPFVAEYIRKTPAVLCLVAVICLAGLSGPADALSAGYPAVQSEAGGTNQASSVLVKPVSRITVEGFSYSGGRGLPYCFKNAEGRCLNDHAELFTDIEGAGRFGDRLSVYYRAEKDTDGRTILKKGYVVLRTSILSWEVGKDTVWLGQGYHGSLLLSDNAEGFLLARVRTEEPFRLPWIFSALGEFRYDLFRGWSDNSSLLGQRLSLRPWPIFEAGFNQVVFINPGKRFNEVLDYPRIFSSSSDNSGSRADRFNNDQIASIDLGLDMPFLRTIPPFVNGKVYWQYGGNDMYAFWQREDRHKAWKGIGFEFMDTGWLAGLFLATESADFRIEYAGLQSYPAWYDELSVRRGLLMGHHVGSPSDDWYFEVNMRNAAASLRASLDIERRGFPERGAAVTNPPETTFEYGLSPRYRIGSLAIFADLLYDHVRNADVNSDPLVYDIRPGRRRDEFIAGLGVEVNL